MRAVADHPARLWLLALAALAAACGDTPELPRLAPDARVLAFGDSLTHGTGAGPGASYPEVLEALIGREVVRSAKPGELSSGARRRLPDALDRVDPALVILGHGGNDILQGRDAAQSRADIAAMVRMAQERGIAVVLLGVPARGLFSDTAERFYSVAAQADVPLEDGVVAEILADPSLKSDRVHPNAAGYRRMAVAIHRLLVAAGAVE